MTAMPSPTDYRPLPSCLTIAPSDIDGLGLFAVEDIAAGYCLGITHYDLRQTDVGKLVRTPLAGHLNHADDPNCIKTVGLAGSVGVYRLAARWAIAAGDELTVRYTLVAPPQLPSFADMRGFFTDDD